MKAEQIIDIIEQHYPLSLQEEWDKCGLQIGNVKQEVSKMMIALNADIQTLHECIREGCQMLVTHHPFLLDPINSIDYSDFMGRFIFDAIENHIVVYSSHTALDRVSMNHWLIEKLGVHDIQSGDASGICQMGTLDHVYTQDELIRHVKDVYQLDHLHYAGSLKEIRTVAICGGSGADFLPDYYGKVDAFITGDTKYRHAKNAWDHHMLLIDIHHHAEKIMVHQLKKLLEKEVDIEIVEGTSPDYYTYI